MDWLTYSWLEKNMWWIAVLMSFFGLILLLFPVFLGYGMKKEDKDRIKK